jgi:hypothetical protein
MAELLILVVIAAVVLLYAVDRARKLRARARQMSGMNERLDVAAAKVDEQRERKQARVRASAELTSVMPAIKRPPLTLPGVPGPAAGPAEEPAAPEPAGGPAGEKAVETTPATANGASATARKTPVVTGGAPAPADAGNTLDDAGTDESPSTQEPDVVPDATPAPKLQTTPDGTLIMPPVPGQGPAPAGETARSPAPSRARPRASRPGAAQPRAPQPRASQSRAGQQCTSQEQANRD